jgi:hypothetical protein
MSDIPDTAPGEFGGNLRDLAALRARVVTLEAAVDWVLNDAAFKAPEQIGEVGYRWIEVLREARWPTEGSDDEL